ncbi:MAG: tetratricopeptide repeat protein [Bacteroidales bacterium]|nr:tetratricopeptide repeat protein [Bacteroidales bacterium]
MKKILTLIAGVVLMAACSTPDREKEIKAIAEHEQMLSAIDVSSDDKAAMDMLAMYRQFAAHFPEDSLAPAYMTRAADLCINLGKSDDAVELLDSVISQYPGYEDIAGCYFLKGYAYESAEQYEEAKEAYTYFVENYPDHYLAADTKVMLNYIGMSPEAMFDAIMANATDQNLAQE